MEPIADNMQKYANYREQMTRLSKAIKAEFYLEAIFIEYAIIEDRLESVLRHSGKFNPEKHNTMDKKLKRVEEMQRAKTGSKVLLRKYISDELKDSIYQWKKVRNDLIHALMKQSLHTADLQKLAMEGQAIVKTLNSKVSSYNRALKKTKRMEEK
jgi:hypothetical protein